MEPNILHRLARFIGTRFGGLKGVDRLLRLGHNPDIRSESWVTTVTTAYPDGPRYNVETKSYVEWTIYFYGTQDRAIHNWILQHAKSDWVALDVGANCGFFTTLLAGQCEEVHGFEPVPALARRAAANLELNRFGRARVNCTAISEIDGVAMMNLPGADDANWGTGSIVHRPDSWSGQTAEVPLTTLDRYCLPLTRIDFIKIDVEGAEHLVLRGAMKLLRQHHPIIIVERNKESETEVVSVLRDLGYAVTSIAGRALSISSTEGWPRDILAQWSGRP